MTKTIVTFNIFILSNILLLISCFTRKSVSKIFKSSGLLVLGIFIYLHAKLFWKRPYMNDFEDPKPYYNSSIITNYALLVVSTIIMIYIFIDILS